MADVDPRLLRVGIEVSGQMRFYDQLAISASGTKFQSHNQGECTVTLTNLRKDVRDFILTETSPFNRNPSSKRIVVEAGRQSTGLTLLYTGNIFRSTVSQPPDQTITIKCLTGQFSKGDIVATAFPGTVPLSRIARQVADDIGTRVDFQATDKQIAGYSFTGSSLRQVEKLGEAGGVNAFVDNDTLFVKDSMQPLSNRIRVLSPNTGLVGIPEPTEQGIRVNMLYDNQTVVGGRLDLTSNLYPNLTGRYVIYKLFYHLTNRDTPFYLTAEANRMML